MSLWVMFCYDESWSFNISYDMLQWVIHNDFMLHNDSSKHIMTQYDSSWHNWTHHDWPLNNLTYTKTLWLKTKHTCLKHEWVSEIQCESVSGPDLERLAPLNNHSGMNAYPYIFRKESQYRYQIFSVYSQIWFRI